MVSEFFTKFPSYNSMFSAIFSESYKNRVGLFYIMR